ncbi:MAG: ectonucleotide pyrophosphatase/phosphodiesterase [Terracidiphilus sp.]|nr:ectonucleotide pyrophosphatase/phosphodiesterase [Terracidiphilus sp.]
MNRLMRIFGFCRRGAWTSALFFGLAAVAVQVPAQVVAARTELPVIHVDNGPNSADAQNAHYVVLVSLDGFRWDYAKRDNATNLLALGKAGVWAPEGMLPSFPSLTFPNHYTIATGLYPEHHGLVGNSFYDADKKTRYAISDQSAVTDGSWYGGMPLWSLAESQGMRTACLFWPGSEAKIAGYRPAYYMHFDDKVDEEARIEQVLSWLRLPGEVRPHFITLYYSDADHAGHAFGPNAPETHAAVHKLDGLIGKLKAGLDATGLPIDLVVVSDHGMVHEEGAWITLDQFADLKGFETAGPLLYAETEADRERVYNQLKKASGQFAVYRLKNVPANLHFNENPREGDPVVIATGPYSIRAHGPAAGQTDKTPIPGMHGFDPRAMQEMKASFFAAGPDIRQGRTVLPFENVNLYPWIAHMLGLTAGKTDGSLNVLAETLRDGGAEPVR